MNPSDPQRRLTYQDLHQEHIALLDQTLLTIMAAHDLYSILQMSLDEISQKRNYLRVLVQYKCPFQFRGPFLP